MRKRILFVGLFLLLSVGLLNSAQAGEVTGYEVWLNRHKWDSLVTYEFASDVWGIGIQSITLTAPTSQTYAMEYDTEEEEWMFDKEGGDEIPSEFTDGAYSFTVEHMDPVYTETLYAVLGGIFPPFPVCTSLEKNGLTWEAWTNPEDPCWIELEIGSESDGGLNIGLPYTATSYDFPDGFIQNNSNYSIQIYFVSCNYNNGYKGSILRKVLNTSEPPAPCICDIEPAEGDGDVDGSDLSVYAEGDTGITFADFAAEFGHNNCP